MSESHYPECPTQTEDDRWRGKPCYCNALRACEQRKDAEYDAAFKTVSYQIESMKATAVSDERERIRKGVEALLIQDYERVNRDAVLAVIDNEEGR